MEPIDNKLEKQISTAQMLHRAGRLSEAESFYADLLEAFPKSVDVLSLAGALKLQLGKAQDAATFLSEALTLSPDLVGVRTNLGYALFLLRRFHDALRELDAVLLLAPDFATAHNHRGLVLGAIGHYGEALTSFKRALSIQPDDVDATINRGNMLHKLGHSDEAIAAYVQATKLQPHNATAHFSLGRGLAAENRPRDALASYDRALAIQQDYPEALWAKGVTKLMLGDYRDGWALYENRWRSPSFGHAPRNFPKPTWDGGPLAGKTILVHAEQGFGDTIQFCRYIPVLATQGARVLLIAQPELAGLLRASPLPCSVFAPSDKIPAFDVHCALMSLPHLIGTTVETVPCTIPYIAAPPNKVSRWTDLLGAPRKLRVGLTWSGRRTHIDDQRRSINLKILAPLLELDAEFHCLQTEISDADHSALNASDRIRAFDIADRDFGDAAAHIAAMDLVISVDTSLAHLAGAMGKPVWIILAHKPDFRWMLERADSPWYPTARLIRQSRKGAWSDVIAQITADLQKRLG